MDAAASLVPEDVWTFRSHEASCVPYERFADRHQVVDRAEILFFRGYAGENVRYMGRHEANGNWLQLPRKGSRGY